MMLILFAVADKLLVIDVVVGVADVEIVNSVIPIHQNNVGTTDALF
jgi:hypothetical protein